MAKNVRIVPSSGSIFFTGDGFDTTGSIRLQTVGSTENVQFIDGTSNESIILIHKASKRVGIGLVSASAKLEVSSSNSEDVLKVGTPDRIKNHINAKLEKSRSLRISCRTKFGYRFIYRFI